jgi:hypothetical protein
VRRAKFLHFVRLNDGLTVIGNCRKDAPLHSGCVLVVC